MKKVTLLLMFAALFFVLANGCGLEETTTSESSASCCLNEQFYDCPSGDAASQCSLADGPGDCDRDSSRDDECEMD